MLNRYVPHRQSQFSVFSYRQVESAAQNSTDELSERCLNKSSDSKSTAKLGMYSPSVPDPNPSQSLQTNLSSSDHSSLSDGRSDGSKGDAIASPDHQPNNTISIDVYSRGLQVQHIAQQQRLRQVERSLRSSLNLSTIYGTTVVEAAAFLKAKQVSLLRYHSASQSWYPVAQYCRDQSLAWGQPLILSWWEYPDLIKQLVQGKAVTLYRNQPALMTFEARQWLACCPGSWLLVPVKKSHTRSYPAGYPLTAEPDSQRAAHPLRNPSIGQTADDDHWGILALALPEDRSWPVDEIACAQSIALELSLAMHQAQQYELLLVANQELQTLALSDGLTQLANRRRFDEHLTDEWQRLAREQRPLSLILCDLDHFKRYNDAFGHPAGDRCLIRIARALLSGPQRPADLVARYGGEEFAIILPNTDTKGAWRIAQKIHSSVRDQKIAHAPNHKKPYVTVTMGVSTIVPGHETTAQVLVQAADLALYHAKQQGRDRTYVHAHYNTVSPEATTSDSSEESAPVAMIPPEDE